MKPESTTQIILTKRPEGMPTEDDFAYREVTLPECKPGQLLLRTLYLSVDPYMRGRMSDRKSYVPPYELQEAIVGGAVAEVVESASPDFQTGDVVVGFLGWQTYQVVDSQHVRKIDPEFAPISTALGILGMTGLTAYFGLLDIGQPKEGETVVVSGAAGAVGMVVGQIAKIKGARVVGIAGSEEKARYLVNELGFDAVVNYKTAENIEEELQRACPNGVDVYFDNVGGNISDAVLHLLNKHARIPICGQIALYNLEKEDIGPRSQIPILKKSALMKGFIVNDYADRFPEGLEQLGQWLKEGKLSYTETIVEGFENTIQAFLGLFRGQNTGKQLVKVAERTINS